jgi:hypothetical protein
MKTLLIASTAVALLAAANLAPATAQATKPVRERLNKGLAHGEME